MRACFLGQNVTALGFGVAMLQTPPLPEQEIMLKDDEEKNEPEQEAQERSGEQTQMPKDPA
jgi:hypothetical protein